MADSDSDDRRQGVELGDLDDDLETHDYPMTTDELIDAHGDHELGLPDGSETVREALEPVGEETYDDAEQVRQMLFTMVGSEAVGREGYSDRGAPVEDPDDDPDTDSL